jgi:hypothetical protein
MLIPVGLTGFVGVGATVGGANVVVGATDVMDWL